MKVNNRLTDGCTECVDNQIA